MKLFKLPVVHPEIIVDHMMCLNDHIESLESELNEAKEEIRDTKALLNQNSKNSNKPPSTDSFIKKKIQRDEITELDSISSLYCFPPFSIESLL